jgi:hypothetical protein
MGLKLMLIFYVNQCGFQSIYEFVYALSYSRRDILVYILVSYVLDSLHFRSLMWVGPTLLYSTATSVMMLGWDGVPRALARIGTPNAGEDHSST